ncbi:MAG: excinuclease ABC subunit C [Acidobacteria bacterium]|nr:MAG: excinuclease ABC subunit C [Acidobacteriota bacterium]PYV42854.1 MAG: excinuclease ABC subunit C [Acidobacteriota bacterium]
MGELEKKLENLPASPGVYIYKNDRGKVIYVGKARSLRSRVRSYFQESRPLDPKTDRLVSEIAGLEYILTDNEVEALILESTLVKQHQPRYNVHLKDDKSFPYLKLTVNEPYPRIFITRRIKKDGALYFGPFLPASYARRTIKLVNKYFKLRTCNLEIDGTLPRPCLDYQMKRCLGPCVSGLCSKAEYDRAVEDVKLLLSGKTDQLIRELELRMAEAAERLNYEAAAIYRDWITMVQDMSERQKMILAGQDDADLFGYFQDQSRLALAVFAMRGERVVGRREFYWEDLLSFDPGEFFSSALKQYYLQDTFTPKEIYIPVDIEEADVLEAWLTERRGSRVYIRSPKRGSKAGLLDLVMRNAQMCFDMRFRVLKPRGEQVLKPLQEILCLSSLPRRIETFDISHIQGSDTVASMVVCENGDMKKSDYRKFIVESVKGPDDFASMREVVHRHYENVLEEDEGKLPDLILIDGGKGQLAAAVAALEDLGLESQPVAAIAKKEEVLFVKGREDLPIRLPMESPVLHLVQTMRDEAHRFAVTYHRKRRDLRDYHSELDEIPGIGEVRKKVLLRAFGSLERVRQAGYEELAPYVGPRAAARILEYFEGQQNPPLKNG